MDLRAHTHKAFTDESRRIVDEKPDAVINVIDSTNLDRQLYFTLQLIELGIKSVLAFNMWDEVKQGNQS